MEVLSHSECPVKKALKKLPNHFKQMHPSLTQDEAAKMLKVAKYQALGRGKVQVPVPMQTNISSFCQQQSKSHKGKDVHTWEESQKGPEKSRMHPVPYHYFLNQPALTKAARGRMCLVREPKGP